MISINMIRRRMIPAAGVLLFLGLTGSVFSLSGIQIAEAQASRTLPTASSQSEAGPELPDASGEEAETDHAFGIDPFYLQKRSPGWTYRLRAWDMIGRVYASQGLPPPLPSEVLHALGGDIGAPMGLRSDQKPLPEDAMNVLLLGSDRRAGQSNWRTDSIVILSYDRENKHLGMISLPRDLWVSIPGFGSGRINTADYLGHTRGMDEGQLIKDVIELNLGIPVDYFVRIDLEGFVGLIDSLGGIELVVDCALDDFFFDPDELGGHKSLALETGLQSMDGETALRYSRSRWSTSDFDRARRQQRVLRAIMDGAQNAGMLRRLPELYQSVIPYAETDIELGDILGLAMTAARAYDELSLRARVLRHPATIDYTTPDGAQVLLLNANEAPTVFEAAMRPLTAEERAEKPSQQVTVFDATGGSGFDVLIEERIEDAGLELAAIESRDRGPQTLIFHADTQKAEDAAFELAAGMGLLPGQVMPASVWAGEPMAASPIWAHIGSDWKACQQ